MIIKKIKDERFNKGGLRFTHNYDMKSKDSGNSVLYYNGQIILTYNFHQTKLGSCNFLFAGVNRVFQVDS